MSGEGRRAALEGRLRDLLDEALADEAPPEGVPAELLAALEAEGEPEAGGEVDIAALWAAMTALTQEVRLEGRAVSRLRESLEGLPAAASAAEAAGSPRAGRAGERATRDESLAVLLDVRDRLGRARDACQAHLEAARRAFETSRLLRLFGGEARRLVEATAALEAGYALGIERIDEALAREGVAEVSCLGRPFDPAVMRAVEVEARPDEPDGLVLEVHRPGYERAGELLRPAAVKVSRRAP